AGMPAQQRRPPAGLLVPPPQQGLDRLQQFLHFPRTALVQHLIGFGYFAVQVQSVGIAREKDDRQFGGRLAELPDHFSTIHFRHHVIDHSQVDFLVLKSFQALTPATSSEHVVTTLFEDVPANRQAVNAVVDTKDAGHENQSSTLQVPGSKFNQLVSTWNLEPGTWNSVYDLLAFQSVIALLGGDLVL